MFYQFGIKSMLILPRYQYDIYSQSWQMMKMLISKPDQFTDIHAGKLCCWSWSRADFWEIFPLLSKSRAHPEVNIYIIISFIVCFWISKAPNGHVSQYLLQSHFLTYLLAPVDRHGNRKVHLVLS